MPPAKLAAALFHDPLLAPPPTAPLAGRGPRPRRDHRRLPRGDLAGPVLVGALPVRPQARAAAGPDHRADPGRRAVRRPADPGRARAALRRADRRRRLRRGRRVRARDARRAAGRVRRAGGVVPGVASPCPPAPRAESAGEVQLLPPDAVPVPAGRLRLEVRLVRADLPERELRPGPWVGAVRALPGRARVRGPARLRRDRGQRAPPVRLRADAVAEPDGGGAHPADLARADHGARQRHRHPRQPAAGRRGDRDARPAVGRAGGLRVRARHRLGVLRAFDQPGEVAGALRRGARPDRQGVDVAGDVLLVRCELRVQVREHLAAAGAAVRTRRSTYPGLGRPRR